MPQDHVKYFMEQAFSKGVMDAMPEEQKRQVSGAISYILSKDAVFDLEDTLENMQFISGIVKQVGKDTYAIGNFLCAGGGIIIGGTSALNFYQTKNPIARLCYGVSVVCGGSATIAGTFTAFNGVCGLSYVAVGGDIIGGSFLWVGNRVKNFGDFIDGKKSVNPFRPKSFVRRPIGKMGTGYKGLSFVPNSGSGNLTDVLSNIPYTKIVMVAGTVFTIYRSGKLIIRASRSIHRYMKKKFTPKLNYSYVVRFSAKYLIESFEIQRINKIYSVALQLAV